MVLNPGALDWESSTLTTRPKDLERLAPRKNFLGVANTPFSDLKKGDFFISKNIYLIQKIWSVGNAVRKSKLVSTYMVNILVHGLSHNPQNFLTVGHPKMESKFWFLLKIIKSLDALSLSEPILHFEVGKAVGYRDKLVCLYFLRKL